MKSIEDMSPQELRELADKKEKAALKIKPIIKDVDIGSIVGITEEYLQSLQDGTTVDDIEHYIYETVMEAVYGKEVWIYINSILKTRIK